MCLSYTELDNKDITARKPHRCDWCAERIEKGAPCRYRSGVFDGEFTWGWQHPECYDAMTHSTHDALCDGWMPGDFERGQASM